jgi:hypothetical protein
MELNGAVRNRQRPALEVIEIRLVIANGIAGLVHR